jgi:hypothetical protein
MPRKVRIQYPGAVYHLMSRGNRREDIFLDDVDRQDFLKTLAEACQKTGWQNPSLLSHAQPLPSGVGDPQRQPGRRHGLAPELKRVLPALDQRYTSINGGVNERSNGEQTSNHAHF